MNRLRQTTLTLSVLAAAGLSSQGFGQMAANNMSGPPGVFDELGGISVATVEPSVLSRSPVATPMLTALGSLRSESVDRTQPERLISGLPMNQPLAIPSGLVEPTTPAGSSTQSGSEARFNQLLDSIKNARNLEAGASNTDTSSETDGESGTAGVLCDLENVAYNSQPSLTYTSEATWRCTDTARSLVANGIPDHTVGEFPNANNPNAISEQRVSETFSIAPTESTAVTELGGPRGAVGYVLNGVKIDADTAGSCDDSGQSCSMIGKNGNWNIEALGQSHFDFGTDSNNAHVQPDGAYHYHGMPEGYLEKQGADGASMVLIGWAADGFPIYARYGYSDPLDANSGLKTITGSYTLVSSVPSNRPSVNSYALGTFKEDWVYSAGSGDLDECNGRFGVTPEFPGGIYHYYATDTYPYFQRCVRGAL